MQKRLKLTRQMANLFSSLQSHKNHGQDPQVSGEQYATQTLLAITDTLEIDRHKTDGLRQSANTSQITSWNQNSLYTLDYGISQQPVKRARLRIRERKQQSRDNAYLQNKSLLTQLDHSVRVDLQRPQMPLREKTENSQHFLTLEVEKERVKSKREIILEIINCKHQIASVMATTIKKSRVDWKELGFVKENGQARNYQSIRKKQILPYQRDNQKQNEGESAVREMRTSEYTKGSLRPALGLAKIKGRSLKKMFTE